MFASHSARPVDLLYGVATLDAWFHGDDRASVPWPRAGELKANRAARAHTLAGFVAGAPRLVEIDPRELFASQWGVVRHHAAYYLTGAWERTGRTSADTHQRSNQYPLIAVDDRGRLVIRAGHHRSLAALLEGRLLRCRLYTAPVEVGDAVAVTPSLLVGSDSPLTRRRLSDPVAAAASIEQGRMALVPSIDAATATLTLLGLTDTEIAFRLRLATPTTTMKGTP